MTKKLTATLRVRMAHSEAHYTGGLMSGSKIMELFGDAATEILIRHDGQEGLFRAYQEVEFLAPVMMGDFIEVTATLTKVGNSSREITFEAYKVIEDGKKVLEKPLLVAKAKGTCVIKK